MAANEEEIKIRERLVSLETKLDFLSSLLQEIKDGLKDTPSKEEFREVELRVEKLEKTQTKVIVRTGILSGILGLIGGALMKIFMA